MVRRSWSCFFLIAIAGCSPSLPGKLAGESAHFRLFVDPDLDLGTLAPSQQGQQALDALETDWADKQTMLRMPEGQRKIDYHLLTAAHVSEVCDVELVGGETSAGCEVAGALQIAASYLPHQHELMHAYMELVAPGAIPIPFLVEGTAQSIGCATEAGTQLTYDVVPWQQGIVETARDLPTDVYDEGGLFVRYLIRTQGTDAFVQYYRQAPGRRDPALFAANFSAFWGTTVDQVWTAMHVVQPGGAGSDDSICPCSLSALPVDGQPIAADVANPYWTIPDAVGASIGVTAPVGEGVSVHDCAGIAPELVTGEPGFTAGTPHLADANVTLLQLADGRSHYLVGTVSQAATGGFVADSCAEAAPYALPADFLSGPGKVWVLASQTITDPATTYLRLQVPSAAGVAIGARVEICDSCAFAQGACPAAAPLPGVTSTVGAGPLNVALLPSPVPQGTPGPWTYDSVLQFSQVDGGASP